MLTITVEIPDYADDAAFSDAVLEGVSKRLVEKVESAISDAIAARYNELIDAKIVEAISPLVADVMEKGFTITDDYGRARSTKTVRDLILEAVTPNSPDRYGRTKLPTLVTEHLRTRFDKEVEAGCERLRATINETITGKITETLAKAFGVPTAR